MSDRSLLRDSEGLLQGIDEIPPNESPWSGRRVQAERALQVNAPRLLRAYVEREKRLKALVEQWREQADGVEATGYSQQADRMRQCADELLAVLEAEQVRL